MYPQFQSALGASLRTPLRRQLKPVAETIPVISDRS
jgi:hypothetical protein